MARSPAKRCGAGTLCHNSTVFGQGVVLARHCFLLFQHPASPVIVKSFFTNDENQNSSWIGRFVSFVWNFFKQPRKKSKREDYLIPFYDALAMIQTECFVGPVARTATIARADAPLVWPHEDRSSTKRWLRLKALFRVIVGGLRLEDLRYS